MIEPLPRVRWPSAKSRELPQASLWGHSRGTSTDNMSHCFSGYRGKRMENQDLKSKMQQGLHGRDTCLTCFAECGMKALANRAGNAISALSF